MPSSRLLLIAATSLTMSAPAALAIGFDAVPTSIPMGSALDVAVPLQLQGDEAIEPGCLAAEVSIGDRRLPGYAVHVAHERGAYRRGGVIRVSSQTVIDEPVVTVQLTVGCASRVVRQFTMLGDLPMPTAAAAPVTGRVAPDAALDSARPVEMLGGTSEKAAGGASAPLSSVSGAAAASAPARRTTAVARKPARKPAQGAARVGPPTKARASEPARAAASGPARSRLSLEPADPEVLRQAVAAAMAEHQASAALAAAQAASAASAAAARLQGMEREMEGLRLEGARQREELLQLRTRLSKRDAASQWMPWLLAALVAVAALGVWMGWRMARSRARRDSQWWADARQVLADAQPDTPARVPAAPVAPASPAPVAAPAAPLAALATAEAERYDDLRETPTMPSEVSWTSAQPPRPVSVDELIDLEQQADFFVVLGQDDAAIELLVGHLRDSGGTSPLPYLKLLEIYRRRGERDLYDRTRRRFNQRFNAFAPEWGTDMEQGRSLDEYPEVMQRLERAWPSPVSAMAELEALLFRRDGGKPFDLPAYRELILLYSLAHGLRDDPALSGGDVDVLLPLDEPFRLHPDPADDEGPGEKTQVLAPDVTPAGRDPSSPRHDGGIDFDLGEAGAPPPRKGDERA